MLLFPFSLYVSRCATHYRTALNDRRLRMMVGTSNNKIIRLDRRFDYLLSLSMVGPPWNKLERL